MNSTYSVLANGLVKPTGVYITFTTPYYENGYGLNTVEECEPLSGEKSTLQSRASGCLYPLKDKLHTGASVIVQERNGVTCEKLEYLTYGAVEYQYCVYDKNKRFVVGYVFDGKYHGGQPVCSEEQAKQNPSPCAFFIPENHAQLPSLLKNKSVLEVERTEVCTDCSVKSPEPVSPMSEVAIQGIEIERLAREQILTSTSLNCEVNFEIPLRNPDLYFYNQSRSASDPNCSYQRYLEIKNKVKTAAEEFGVNENLLLCSMDRESKNIVYKLNNKGEVIKDSKGRRIPEYMKAWDTYAVSDSGAVGLGQFLKSSFDYTVSTIASRSDYRNLWSNYFSKTPRRTPPSEEELRTISGITDRTALTNCDLRCDPDTAIAAKALYYRYIFDNYGNNYENRNTRDYSQNLRRRNELSSKRNRTAQEEQEFNRVKTKVDAGREYMVFITGGYNRGPATIGRAMRNGTGAYQWQRNLVSQNGGAGSEVDSHMRNIQRCMRELER